MPPKESRGNAAFCRENAAKLETKRSSRQGDNQAARSRRRCARRKSIAAETRQMPRFRGHVGARRGTTRRRAAGDNQAACSRRRRARRPRTATETRLLPRFRGHTAAPRAPLRARVCPLAPCSLGAYKYPPGVPEEEICRVRSSFSSPFCILG